MLINQDSPYFSIVSLIYTKLYQFPLRTVSAINNLQIWTFPVFPLGGSIVKEPMNSVEIIFPMPKLTNLCPLGECCGGGEDVVVFGDVDYRALHHKHNGVL